jgi:GNAT superfamily N-acetyltransferase
MTFDVAHVPVEEIAPLRELYRHDMHCQIIHDSFARRGFSDAYRIRQSGRVVGYGLVAHQHYPETVHEFYVVPAVRQAALPMFRSLLEASGATHVLAQSNDRPLLLLLHDCTTEITSECVLFEDRVTTTLACPGGVLRPVIDQDCMRLRAEGLDPDAGWIIEAGGIPVAAGGVLFHYNPPYGDIYMGVHEAHRRRGFGSYLVQELKRISYEMGKIPAARCNVANEASRRTLEKAGLLPCGRMLIGRVEK